MAFNFVETSDNAYETAYTVSYPFTVASWVYVEGDTHDDNGVFACVDYTNGSAGNWHTLRIKQTTRVVESRSWAGGTTAFAASSAGLSLNTWSHVCGVWTNATTRAAYLNGGNKGSPGSGDQSPSGLERTYSGGYERSATGFTDLLNGSLAEFAIWNVALTDDEVASLAKGFSSLLIRPASLVRYRPFIRDSRDLKSNGTLTVSGTTVVSHVPKIIYPATVFVSPIVAAGGTTYPQSVAGAISPGGAITRHIGKGLVGAITPAGTITKQTSKPLSGAITPAGSLIKRMARTLTGAISPVGILSAARTARTTLTGAISPAGTVVKRTFKAFGGSTGPAGNLAKLTTKAFGGSISPAGTLDTIRTFLKAVSGAISPAGALTIQTSKVLAGTVAPVGSLTKRTARALTGAISPSGSLSTIKAFFMSLAGAISPGGSLSKRTGKSLAGAISPAGGITKSVTRSLSGAIGPAGTLATVRVILLSITGAIGPSGEVVKRTFKELSGAISPASQLSKFTSVTMAGAVAPIGGLTKRIGRLLSGALSFLGSVVGVKTTSEAETIRRVELHLPTRTTLLTLEDRMTSLTLGSRSTSLTLNDFNGG